jgi:hypothetical protein
MRSKVQEIAEYLGGKGSGPESTRPECEEWSQGKREDDNIGKSRIADLPTWEEIHVLLQLP